MARGGAASPQTNGLFIEIEIAIGIAIGFGIEAIGGFCQNDPDPDFDPDFEGSMVLHCENLTLGEDLAPPEDL